MNNKWKSWQCFSSVVMTTTKLQTCCKHAPIRHKVLRGIICPWLTSATKKLMNERDSFLRKARKTGFEVNWSTYRWLRNQVSHRIKIEKHRYQRNEIQDNLANPKSFWRAMKSIFPKTKTKTNLHIANYIENYGESCQCSITTVPTEIWPFESLSGRV